MLKARIGISMYLIDYEKKMYASENAKNTDSIGHDFQPWLL